MECGDGAEETPDADLEAEGLPAQPQPSLFGAWGHDGVGAADGTACSRAVNSGSSPETAKNSPFYSVLFSTLSSRHSMLLPTFLCVPGGRRSCLEVGGACGQVLCRLLSATCLVTAFAIQLAASLANALPSTTALFAAVFAAWLVSGLERICQGVCVGDGNSAGSEASKTAGMPQVSSVTDGPSQGAIFDCSEACGFWAPIEEVDVEECGPETPAPAASLAEQLVAEYQELARLTNEPDPGTSVEAGASGHRGTAPAPVALQGHGTLRMPRKTKDRPPRLRPPQSPAPSFPPPLTVSPMAKVVSHWPGEPLTVSCRGAPQHVPSRPPSSMSVPSLPSVPSVHQSEMSASGTSSARPVTGQSSTTLASAATRTTGSTGQSSVSTISVLSLGQGGLNVDVDKQCDLEALKERYIEAITARGDALVGDRRVDGNTGSFSTSWCWQALVSWLLTGALTCGSVGILCASLEEGFADLGRISLSEVATAVLLVLVLDFIGCVGIAVVRCACCYRGHAAGGE
eukprot:TRINITY_DN39750_c0_g1_i1.p1 TRINITY_DN39750_c0_g1~~TRINITY_DN39750_c0_g1_i1.p1  ORF type:complete len:515 (+),score=86.02 TRINITY_DN39750_c0_g1_i1:137-1681(+)